MAELGVDWVGLGLRGILLLGWVAVLLGIAGVALWRLGTSRAGLSLAAGFGLWALQHVLSAGCAGIASRLPDGYAVVVGLQAGLDLLLTLGALALVGLGLLSLPAALAPPPHPPGAP